MAHLSSLKPRRFFTRTALLVFALVITLELIVLATTANFILAPIMRAATGDFATLIVQRARAWAEQPKATRAHYAADTLRLYRFELVPVTEPSNAPAARLPYPRLLQSQLERLLEQNVTVRQQDDRYFMDLIFGKTTVRVRFDRARIGTHPPLTLVILIGAMIVLSIITALWLARRIAQPLRRLSRAAQVVGQGGVPPPIAEAGPYELAELTQRINRMAQQVRELLQARTVLLAGISHDLRTPLTRLRLGLELAQAEPTPARFEAMARDIAQMDSLIGQALQFARDTQAGETRTCQLNVLIEGIVADARRAGADIVWDSTETCGGDIDADAFSRIVRNLLDNALRYGGDQPVSVVLTHRHDECVVEIADCGPGIPTNVRQKLFEPFTRLDHRSGTGLGLAIAKQLAERNGWDISLANRAEGGTLACLRIKK